MPTAEITGVLMKQAGEDCVPPERSIGTVCVGCAVSFAKTLGTLTIRGVAVRGLTEAGNQAGGNKFKWIDHTAAHQLKFLLPKQRRCVLNIGCVEVGNYSENALMFLLADLFGGAFALRFLCGSFRRLRSLCVCGWGAAGKDARDV